MSLPTERLLEALNRLSICRASEEYASSIEDFRWTLATAARELPAEIFAESLHQVYQKVHMMINGNVHARKTSVEVIGLLADIKQQNDPSRATQLATHLRIIMHEKDAPEALVNAAADSLGKLMAHASMENLELVELETLRALEIIRQKTASEAEKSLSFLILHKMLVNATNSILPFIPSIIDAWWEMYRESHQKHHPSASSSIPSGRDLTSAGIVVLFDCLRLWQENMDEQQATPVFQKALSDSLKGLISGSLSLQQAACIMIQQILRVDIDLLHGVQYDVAFEGVLKLLNHRESAPRHAAVSLLPALALADSNAFVAKHGRAWIAYLIDAMKRDKDRLPALVAMTRTATVLDRQCVPFIDSVSTALRTILLSKAHSTTGLDTDEAVFDCISALAKAADSDFMNGFRILNCALFLPELSSNMVSALETIVSRLPDTLLLLEDRIVEKAARRLHRCLEVPEDHVVANNALVALKCFVSFKVEMSLLDDTVGKILMDLLGCSNSALRAETAKALLYLTSWKQRQPFCESGPSVRRTLDSLIALLAADPSTPAYLDESHDVFVSQSPNLKTIFATLLTGPAELRTHCSDLLVRLVPQNPATGVACLRTLLLELISGFSVTGSGLKKIPAAAVLDHLLNLPERFSKIYSEGIMRVLIAEIGNQEPALVIHVLSAIGKLVTKHTGAMASYATGLLAQIRPILQDFSSDGRREAALDCLAVIIRYIDRDAIPTGILTGLLADVIGLLKVELAHGVRLRAIRLLGVIGAYDPYRLKKDEFVPAVSSSSDRLSIGGGFQNGTTSEDYFPSAAIDALLKVLRDGSLSLHHIAAVQALMHIFRPMGPHCSAFFPQVIPALASVIRAAPDTLLDFYFQHLATLVSSVGIHAKPYATEVLSLVTERWLLSKANTVAGLPIVEALTSALTIDFAPRLMMLVPRIMEIAEESAIEDPLITAKIVTTLVAISDLLGEAVHSVLELAVRLVSQKKVDREISSSMLRLVRALVRESILSNGLVNVVTVIAACASISDPEIQGMTKELAITAASSFVETSSNFLFMLRQRLNLPVHKDILDAVHEETTRIQEHRPARDFNELYGHFRKLSLSDTPATSNAARRHSINEENLKRCWDTFSCVSKEDWFEWTRSLGINLLKESPSHALRACASLSSTHYPLAKELFNAAFVSCWNQLSARAQDEIVSAFESVLSALTVPSEVVQTLLDLAEFMEHDERPLPMDVSSLGAYASKCHAFAKALYYKEMEFVSNPSADVVESLIGINNQLQQPDAAVGALVYAQKHHGIALREEWYEKLQRWSDAFDAYARRLEESPDSLEASLGLLRCEHALGDWEQLNTLARDIWTACDDSTRASVAPLAAAAAWGLLDWTSMERSVKAITPTLPDGSFFRAVLAVHEGAYAEAEALITKTREQLDTELTALISESYGRSYNLMVRVQMLSELEEVVSYQRSSDNAKHREIIRRSWDQRHAILFPAFVLADVFFRLKCCRFNADVWLRALRLRALVIAPEEDPKLWVKLSNMCLKSGRPVLARRLLLGILSIDEAHSHQIDMSQAPPLVVYEYLKHNWETGEREVSIRAMQQYAEFLAHRLEARMSEPTSPVLAIDPNMASIPVDEHSRLLAKCYLRLGQWKKVLAQERSEDIPSSVLEPFLSATSYGRTWHKAWHGWALANYELANIYERKRGGHRGRTNPYIVPAIQGFFRSISYSKGDSLQDSLRLLTMWFKYGAIPEVTAAVGDGFQSVPADNWLQVIPQLIARIHVPTPQVRRMIHQVLSDIGRLHPQGLIYPLVVAAKSQSVSRRTSALTILDKMRAHSAKLVDQAQMVSHELIRAAIVWEELWQEAYDEASRVYYGEHNISRMLAIFEPLHLALHKGAETTLEQQFLAEYGDDLEEAYRRCAEYRRTGALNELNVAWDKYHLVYRKIQKRLPQMATIELELAAPKLLTAKGLELAVPGTYRVGWPTVSITSIAPTMAIISSKQRPRRLTIIGSDGLRYRFLLKGHEDLRQDQRVMQLFGLINTLLASDSDASVRHLNIQQFSVIPLSQNSGLIGWVSNCDTMHSLIREYRDAHGVALGIEHRHMQDMAANYELLPTLQKVEIFEHAMLMTNGQDLAKIFWKKSKNAEAWFDRRTVYTRSLSVMSMVGYVLGLGDRHPSNLMIDQVTGKVIHIDFGDCFETAMKREKFPERVPFRLTRMLVNAMEVSGVEGTFRITAEHTMRIMRASKDSLMAVLEAFVYDPLINWRLLARPVEQSANDSQYSSGHIVVTASSGETRGVGDITSEESESGNLKNESLKLSLSATATATTTFPLQFSASRRIRLGEDIALLEEESIARPEILASGALNVINRVSGKLSGRDFRTKTPLDVTAQVDRLIWEAKSVENLCQAYLGWCPFW